jgi:hypothetical protein
MSNLIVIGTQWKVSRDNPNLKDPSTIRVNMKVTRAYAESIQLNAQKEPNYLLRFEIDEEKTAAFNGQSSVDLSELDKLGYSVPAKPKTESKPKAAKAKTPTNKHKGWMSVVSEMKAAETVEQLKEIFKENAHTHSNEKVQAAFKSNLAKLTKYEN